ncbi:MAG: Unknown protein [uncultured Sulfurovum sp.]|uniref:Uncharacterized protein n=1 Tax=uncultured Sulfurovum sp. TaxID=269237 RepID=A0A6S6TN36_9BACT|nr:MAG: Unknown protein [uncultured Sulfurovum sp.]
MTKKELSINISWDEFEMGTCGIFVETLDQYIRTVFFQDHKPQPTISDKMLQGVNDILDMDIKEFERLEEILGIEDYKQSKIEEIHLDQDNDLFDGVYAEVIIAVGSHTHIAVIVKDGTFMCINDGTYFDTLEVSDKQTETKGISEKDRENFIAMMSEE